MTDMSTDPKAAKAQAKAAKAHAKALRPWYRKKRFWALGFIGILVIAGVAGGGGSSDTGGDDTAAPASASSDVTTKLSSNTDNPPADDVEVTRCYRDDLGHLQADLKVTNNSSKRSSYTMNVAFETGSTQLDTSAVFVNNLEPGQSTTEEAMTFEEHEGEFTCRITDVERFAS